jgi:hypothetical protein
MYGMRGYGSGQGFPGYNTGFHQSGMSGTTGYEQYNQQFNTAQVTLFNNSLSILVSSLLRAPVLYFHSKLG